MPTDEYDFIIEVDKDRKPRMFNVPGFVKFFNQYEPGERLYGKVTRKRTLKQNKLIHVWIGLLADYAGELDFHKFKKQVKFKMGWFTEWVNEETGEIVLEWEQTSLWSRKKMRENLEKLHHWSQEFYGFYLPWPEEYREANSKTT